MIIVTKLVKKWGDRSILNGVSFHFPENGCIALVGPNGTGKTTLLNILCGKEEYDSGEIVYPNKLKLGYMPQVYNQNPKETVLHECISGAHEAVEISEKREALLAQMETNFSNEIFEEFERIDSLYYEQNCHRVEHDAHEILKGLGFDESVIKLNPSNLSGGWRMRLELAKILIAKPNFLILDEPTNHLDLPSIQFFETYMQSFQGTLLFVSHDRDLVNRLANYTLSLRGGLVYSNPGNLDDLLQKVEEDNSLSEKTRKGLQTRMDQVQRFVDRFRASPSKAKQVQSRLKMLSKLKALEDNLTFQNMDDDMEWSLPEGPKSGANIFLLNELVVGYKKPLTKPFDLRIGRGWRIAVTGANGLGKSTLLKTLVGVNPPYKGEINVGSNVQMGYFAQESSDDLNAKLTILENVVAKAKNLGEGQVRSLLGMLGLSGDDVFKKVSILSGGEKSRVALACLCVQSPNVLILDEPTNHLDMASEEALALALERFSGTVIFVSHNRYFIRTVATHTLSVDSQGYWTFKEV